MPRIKSWQPGEAEKELQTRLRQAKEARRPFETRWRDNERCIYNTGVNQEPRVSLDMQGILSGDTPDSDSRQVKINYAFKNLRFIHAQLSANPPSVVPRPTSNDPEDRRRADAADRSCRYALRQYSLQEVQDRTSLNCLLYGFGVTKTCFDPFRGDMLEVDQETGDITLEGDIAVTVPSVWNIFLDPDATCWDEVRYVFERITCSYEEACYMFPDQQEDIEKVRRAESKESEGTGSDLATRKFDTVELFQYWERGLPLNGNLGRFAWCLETGKVLGKVTENPERYMMPKTKHSEASRKAPAVLPYQILTDIDIPNQVYGKSFIEYESSIQDLQNRLDSVMLENIKAHGVARIILPEGSEISDDSITNSPWDIIKFSGNVPPSFMEPMALPPSIMELRNQLKAGGDDMAGVNEAMFGQQSRETSGFSMQYATNQGNMIRRRLFNKYVLYVEQVYRALLRIMQSKWDTKRTISVLGKEKAFEAIDIQGQDLESGFDLVVEYGSSLSLDPTTRRQEIMTMLPLFEKAGVPTRTILGMVKLNELGGMYDVLELAADRQRELFQTMTASGLYSEPQELEDHKNMLDFAYYYLMTTEFKYLQEEQKQLIRQHVKAREQLALQQQTGALGPASGRGPSPQGAEGQIPNQLTPPANPLA